MTAPFEQLPSWSIELDVEGIRCFTKQKQFNSPVADNLDLTKPHSSQEGVCVNRNEGNFIVAQGNRLNAIGPRVDNPDYLCPLPKA
jgi:hypothetical protein